MIRTRLQIATAFAAAAGLAMLLQTTPASAGWRHWCGSSGGGYSSLGSYGSAGYSVASYGSAGSYASHGSHGSHGGLFSRIHARWHARHSHSRGGSYLSSGGSYGSAGSWGHYRSYYGASSGGSYGGASSGGSYGSSYASHGGTYYSAPSSTIYEEPSAPAASTTPATPAAPTPADAIPAPEVETSIGDAKLTVVTPEDSKIYVNGVLTTTPGSVREYISRGLAVGHGYTYSVRAEVVRDGEVQSQTKTVQLHASQSERIAFEFADAAETTLTVNVPADAKVYLAGNETSATGSVRVFKTTGLSTGERWDDYQIRVTVERDGQLVTREKTIALAAGDTKSVTFDLDTEKVASR